MALGTIAALQAGGAALKWGWNQFNKPKRFEDTEYGKRLRDIQKRGAYTDKLRAKIMGGISRTAGAQASRAKTAYRGRLIQQGMEGSIAGVRGEREIGTAYQDKVVDTQREIDFRNEQSKIAAKNRYAQLKSASDAQQKQFSQANNAALVGGLVDAGVGYVGGKMKQKIAAQTRRDKINTEKYKAGLDYKDKLYQRLQDADKMILEYQKYKDKQAYNQTMQPVEKALKESQTTANQARSNYYGQKATGGVSPANRGGSGGGKALQQQINNVFKAIEMAGGQVKMNPKTQKFEVFGGDPKMVPVLRQQLYELLKQDQSLDLMIKTQFNDSDNLVPYIGIQ